MFLLVRGFGVEIPKFFLLLQRYRRQHDKLLGRVDVFDRGNRVLIQGCLLEEGGGSIESGRSDGRGMAHSQPAAPRSGRTWSTDPGQAANGQRYSLGSAHRRSVARHARAIRQLEFSLCALHTLEQARRVGSRIRNLGESWAASRQGACHRFHHRAGAPACSRRQKLRMR